MKGTLTDPIEAVLALAPARITRATAIAATPAARDASVEVDPLTVGVTWASGTDVRRVVAVDEQRRTVEWKRCGRGKHQFYGGTVSVRKWREWCRAARVRGMVSGDSKIGGGA